MAFATYDPSAVRVTFGGLVLTGFVDGTFVTVEFDEDQWNKTTGADGLTQRSKTNNYAGNVTVALKNGSGANDLLSAMWNADRRTNDGVAALTIEDQSGTTLWSAANAWVRQMPSQGFSKSTEAREWVLDTDALTGMAGGNVA